MIGNRGGVWYPILIVIALLTVVGVFLSKSLFDNSIHIGVDRDIELRPLQSQTLASQLVLQLTDKTLYSCEQESYRPVIAEALPTWEGQKLKVQVRDGLNFSDGSPLTRDDVVASLKRLSSSGISYPHKSVWQKWIKNVSAEGDKSVVFELSEKSAFAMNLLCHSFASITKEVDGQRYGAGEYKVVATSAGAFELKSVKSGSLPVKLIRYSSDDTALRALAEKQIDIVLMDLENGVADLPDVVEVATGRTALSLLFLANQDQNTNTAGLLGFLRKTLATSQFVNKAFYRGSVPSSGFFEKVEQTESAALDFAGEATLTLETESSEEAKRVVSEINKVLAPKMTVVPVDRTKKANLWGGIVFSPYRWRFEAAEACVDQAPLAGSEQLKARLNALKGEFSPSLSDLASIQESLFSSTGCIPLAKRELGFFTHHKISEKFSGLPEFLEKITVARN